MSLSGSAWATSALALVPSMKVTRILAAPSTTWNAVRMVPFALTITPVPNPSPCPFVVARFVSIATIDGRICW